MLEVSFGLAAVAAAAQAADAHGPGEGALDAGATVVEGRVRQRGDERPWRRLGRGLDQDARTKLEGLLDVPEGSTRSTLDRLRSGPTRRSAPELVHALKRLEEIRALGINVASAAGSAPPGRILTLARFAATAKVTAVARLTPARRTTTLAAFVHTLEAAAQDDALALLVVLITELFSADTHAGRRARLLYFKDRDGAAPALGRACGALLTPDSRKVEVRTASAVAQV